MLMTAANAETQTCPQCSAANPVETAQCWLCHLPLTAEAGAAGTREARSPTPTPASGLLWVILLVVLAAIVIGVMQHAPGFGIFVAILATPVMIRLFARRSRDASGVASPAVASEIGSFFM